jgi:hypothetical protein
MVAGGRPIRSWPYSTNSPVFVCNKTVVSRRSPVPRQAKRFIQRRRLMRVAIVQYHANHGSFRVAFVHQPLYFVCKVQRRAVLCQMHVPPAGLRFDDEKKIARAVALVFILTVLRLTRLGSQRATCLLDQLLVRFTEVDLGRREL